MGDSSSKIFKTNPELMTLLTINNVFYLYFYGHLTIIFSIVVVSVIKMVMPPQINFKHHNLMVYKCAMLYHITLIDF